MLRRTTLATVIVVLLGLPCGAATKSLGLAESGPLPAVPVVPAVNITRPLHAGQATRTTNDASQKRLRMRQVLLIWLLAAQPSKPVAP
jgi:hypothetical protein